MFARPCWMVAPSWPHAAQRVLIFFHFAQSTPRPRHFPNYEQPALPVTHDTPKTHAEGLR